MTAIFDSPSGIARSACDWSVWLTGQYSVTGSDGERDLPDLIFAKVRSTPALAAAECWKIPVTADGSGRSCAAVLVRGTGRETVLLTGHFDTVTVEDYGELAPLATKPAALLEALKTRVANPATPAEERAKRDFASGDFLPGRGLLDMKAGLGAGLAALEAFASEAGRQGNLLFVGVPDEEVNSVGARALADAIPAMGDSHGLDIVAAINLDCIADDGDGTAGRSVALGSVGKLLLTALAVGQQAHASHPYQGVNAGVLAAALVQRMEWASEFADGHGEEAGIPPTLLGIKDSKTAYDVTTPANVFVTWNTLTMGRGAAASMRIFRKLAEDALGEMQQTLQRRRADVLPDASDMAPLTLIDAATLLKEVRLNAGAAQALDKLAADAAAAGHSLPDQNRLLTEAAWRMSGRRGPAVVLGFGSLPYPPVILSDAPKARRFRAAIDAARARAAEKSGAPIGVISFFPGISDVSFLGEADAGGVETMRANTPAWDSGVRWSGVVGGVPTVNIGPWGRDYHTPLERMHMPYTFGVLPALLLDIATAVLDRREG